MKPAWDRPSESAVIPWPANLTLEVFENGFLYLLQTLFRLGCSKIIHLLKQLDQQLMLLPIFQQRVHALMRYPEKFSSFTVCSVIRFMSAIIERRISSNNSSLFSKRYRSFLCPHWPVSPLAPSLWLYSQTGQRISRQSPSPVAFDLSFSRLCTSLGLTCDG